MGRLKAGTLMEFAAALGVITAEADRQVVSAVTRFGGNLGLGLQMLDDLSGMTNPARRAKGLEDLRLARLTWVWSWLSRNSDASTFNELQRHAAHVADGGDPDALAEIMADRLTGALSELQRYLGAILDDLRTAVGDGPDLDALTEEIQCLERSYV